MKIEDKRRQAREWYHRNKKNIVVNKEAKRISSLKYYYKNREACIQKSKERNAKIKAEKDELKQESSPFTNKKKIFYIKKSNIVNLGI